ncbi:MAG: helix-turn-helix transcriptional regulator, partial [Alcaligenaceae bacterium]|nr:helix-turn-helix transcriptional regulator [Alcaligenaceae bacterium]
MQSVQTVEDFALLIRNRRRALGLSQAQLAEKVGASRQWLIDIEKGKPRAELGMVLQVLAELDVQLQVKTARARRRETIDKDQGEAQIQALAQAFQFLD